jgi:integrase
MYRNRETRRYETDIRRGTVARLHVDLGTSVKADAQANERAVVRLYTGKHLDLIERVRAGDLTPQLLHDHFAAGGTVAELRAPSFVHSAWPTVAEAAAQFLAWVDKNPKRSAGTHAAAEGRLKRFMAFLDRVSAPREETEPKDRVVVPGGRHARLDALGAAVVTAYQTHLIDAGAKPNTITMYVAQIGTMYRWHRTREERDSADQKRPARSLRIPLDPHEIHVEVTRRDRFLSEEEAGRLLAATPEPLLCMVMLGLFAGLRAGEALHLRPAFDIDLERGLLVIQKQPVWKPKTARASRYVPISSELRPVLERQLRRRASEEWVTPAITRPTLSFNVDTFGEHFARIVESAEMVPGRTTAEGVTFHTLRHTFASWLVARGVDLYTVAQLLGDRLEEVERTYAHLSPDFRQRAVDQLAGAVHVPDFSVESSS